MNFSPPLIIVDAHEDVIQRVLDRGDDLGEPYSVTGAQADLNSWREGGVNVVWFSVWVNPRKYQGSNAVKRTERLIGAVNRQVAAHPDLLALCDTAADCRQAVAQGKIAALLGIEGGVSINNDLSMIEKYRRRHVRYMTLTWRGNLQWAGSSQTMYPEEAPNTEKGLTEFGRRVIAELNRTGIIVDLSHVSDTTFFDALKTSTKPVIVSHSNARSLCSHVRNVTDDMLRALAQNGGVIGVNFAGEFLDPNPVRGKKTFPKVTVDTVLNHIDHIVKIVGVDHVGIGSDWDGGFKPPPGLQTAAGMPNLIRGLQQRGYSEPDIRKIAGENFLRVIAANESADNVVAVEKQTPATPTP